MSIRLSNIAKSYGRHTIIKNLSLEIEPGELFVLLGASGSGKSTLLRLIAGLTPLDGGRICLNDRDVTSLPPQKRGVGFVFQNYSLFRHMTAAQNIAFGLEVQRRPRQEREQRVRELLDLIGLADLGNRMPSQLSGGQQQRIALARALAPEPEVLLLDEPFGALDVKIRAQLRQNLRQIQKRLGVTTILVTHDQDEAFALADRIGIIEAGQLLEVGLPEELYRRPQHRFTATFLGTANLLPARRNGSTIYLADDEQRRLPAFANTRHLSGQSVDVMLRPEAIEIAPLGEPLTGHAIGEGVIESILFAGVLERVQIRRFDGGQLVEALLSSERARQMALRPGDRVQLAAQDYHLLPIQHRAER